MNRQALAESALENQAKNMRHEFAAGQVFRMGPRYTMDGYVADNGCGELVRLKRRMLSGVDWYVTNDLQSPLEDADWTMCVHESRLRSSEFMGERESGTLKERIAAALGWTMVEVNSFTLVTLRELLPAGKLRDEVTRRIQSGEVVCER